MRLVRTGSIVTLFSAVNAVASFLGIVLLARIVPSAELGKFFLFQATLGILSIPTSAGINGAVEKRISEGSDGRRILGAAISIKLLILIIVGGGVILLGEYVNSYVGTPVASLLVIGLFFQEGTRLGFRTLRGEKRVSAASILQSARIFLWICGAIGAALLGFGVEGLIYAFLGSYLLMAVACVTLQETGLSRFSTKQIRSIITYAKHNAITSVGGSFYGWMDTAVLGFFVGSSLIAAYEVAWRLSKVGLIVSKSASITTFPQISEWAQKGMQEKISTTVSESFVPALLIVVPVFVGSLLLAQDILSTLYGPEYAVAAGAFTILAAERIIKASNHIISRCLHAIDRPDLSARATVVAILVNLVLNWFLIQSFGIIGAALATSISFAIKLGIEYIYLIQLIKFELPLRALLNISASATAMAAILLLVDPVIQIGPTASLVVSIVFGATCYFAFLLVSKPMRRRAVVVINQMGPSY